jgi:hypothetical protein
VGPRNRHTVEHPLPEQHPSLEGGPYGDVLLVPTLKVAWIHQYVVYQQQQHAGVTVVMDLGDEDGRPQLRVVLIVL